MVEFINLLPTPFCLGKKRSLENVVQGEWVIFFYLGLMMKTWGRVFLGVMSKNEQIQFFESQMLLPMILTL